MPVRAGSLGRTRWAAIGAAVAITLGGGGVASVRAAISSGPRTVFVPITPCRILDTRASSQVGPRNTPLGAAETYTVAGRGTSGQCTIPDNAAGLALNVTAVGASLPTFLTVWGDGARPDASSLNPGPGQPPTPNAVTTDLTDAGGQFNVFNLQGNVDVLADVVGYYADHDHDDRYYTEAETDAAIARVVAIVNGAAPTPIVESGPVSTETIVTPIAGRLRITKPYQFLTATCSAVPPGGIRYFLTLDGVPVASSVQVTGGGSLQPAVLSGTTSGTVAAGTHTIGAAAECVGTPTTTLSPASNPGVLEVLILN
jgi:hypothetical protein